ncbi:ARM repeat-containing protein [Nadsonia fulvescens var. elongata DSM 6958]|uniref:Nucleolar protein 9 n=1 Tax=Nadsonia fulvescens var. elongata DSM 6958 TaxID=857566 RepID=A0A1E3PMZ0_9ASCO|nr:ARM repeat-containing protein [Nadsonia fulvescens var. elongata DSM 6958]
MSSSLAQNTNSMPFYGLVEDQELEYFKQAESTLALDSFGSSEEREGFTSSVFEEAKGKELKLVTNQICSKLVERLILLANENQLCALFKSFSGHFLNLSMHKYSSHCVETLLVRSAALVEKEILNLELMTDNYIAENEDDVFVSMETLILSMLNEFKADLKALPAHPYASHVLRIILLILSGNELPSSTKSNSLVRSKRSKIARKMISIKDNQDFQRSYQVPTSFTESLSDFIQHLVKDLDTKKVRELSIEKIASPVIQLMLKIEASINDDNNNRKNVQNKSYSGLSLLYLIFQTDKNDKDSAEEGFVEYLLSDSVGSHFLESIIEFEHYEFTSRLFNLYMKGRLEKLSRRDNGNYVVQSLLKNLKKVDIKIIIEEILPELSNLLENNNLAFIRTIIDASIKSDNTKTDDIVDKILEKYECKDDKSKIVDNILKLDGSTLGNTRGDWPTNEEMQRSLLIQSLIECSNELLNKVVESLMLLPTQRLLQMSGHSVFSHVLQKVLTPHVSIVNRRKLLNSLSGTFVDMACNPYGSHIVDALWLFTFKLNNYRERIAADLIAEQAKVKDSKYGKSVWKNWNLDKCMRKKYDWWAAVKLEENEWAAQYPQEKPQMQPKKMINKSLNKEEYKKQQADKAAIFKAERFNNNNGNKKKVIDHSFRPNNIHYVPKRPLNAEEKTENPQKKRF